MNLDIDLLMKRYTSLFPIQGAETGAIHHIEKSLSVNLPIDFKCIAKFYNGDTVGGIEHYEMNIDRNNTAPEGTSHNIVTETLRLREAINFPTYCLAIAEPPESFIFLDTRENTPAVVWCDTHDICRIEAQDYLSSPDTWNSYEDFFSYLLDEEEQERQENQ